MIELNTSDSADDFDKLFNIKFRYNLLFTAAAKADLIRSVRYLFNWKRVIYLRQLGVQLPNWAGFSFPPKKKNIKSSTTNIKHLVDSFSSFTGKNKLHKNLKKNMYNHNHKCVEFS